jgi:anti-sigma regulatory factor (Ser/Thr protein kinase)
MTVAHLRHDAFLYDTDAEFAVRMVPFVEAGVEAGESVVAVTTRDNCSLLRDAIGSAFSEEVLFVDRDEWYVRPAHAIAGYDRTLRECLRAGAPAVRVVGEVRFGATPREWAEWTAYEAILNRAFADRPAWIVCPYDTRVLPDPVLERAASTHPHTFAGERHESPHYDDPEGLVRALTPEPGPLAGLTDVPLGDHARDFRQQLASAMAVVGMSRAQAGDLMLAASEILSNALRHGDGSPRLRVGVVGGSFVCEISDQGRGLDDPLAGYIPPRADDDHGVGLWVARQLSARLELMSSPDGLTVRLWI